MQSTTIVICLVLESDNIWSLEPDSGHLRWNSTTVAGILSVSDRISSPVIFILFYINISMLWIKFDFYKLIWLNKYVKKYLWFFIRAKHQKILSTKIILQRKLFYSETKRVSIELQQYLHFFFENFPIHNDVKYKKYLYQ